MPSIVIIGGKLQGMEAAYLGKKADLHITLIDHNPNVIAQNLCDEFICGDVLSDDPDVRDALDSADMVLPTMENYDVLEQLVSLCEKRGYCLAFDWGAYQISSSKVRSDQLFMQHNLPAPKYYPNGTFPYIAKPDCDSGSHGISVIPDRASMESFQRNKEKGYLIQEYIEGPSYSVEIIGTPGNYRVYLTTQILVDQIYDCYSVQAVRSIPADLEDKIKGLVICIAEHVNLRGIMDLEVIDCCGEIKILEIDARLPSQTPIAVYHASGMNYLKELYDLFVHGGFQDEQIDKGHYASVVHMLFNGQSFSVHGEHIMTEGGVMYHSVINQGRTELLSDLKSGTSSWRGMFINHGRTRDALWLQERRMIKEIEVGYSLERFYADIYNNTKKQAY